MESMQKKPLLFTFLHLWCFLQKQHKNVVKCILILYTIIKGLQKMKPGFMSKSSERQFQKHCLPFQMIAKL